MFDPVSSSHVPDLPAADCQTCWNCLSQGLSPFDWLPLTFLQKQKTLSSWRDKSADGILRYHLEKLTIRLLSLT